MRELVFSIADTVIDLAALSAFTKKKKPNVMYTIAKILALKLPQLKRSRGLWRATEFMP